MDLFDLFQQFRIEKNHLDARSKANNLSSQTLDNKVSVEELNSKIDNLSLVCMAMSELLESVGFTKEAQLAKIEEIDLRDGKLDGKLHILNVCSQCKRKSAPRHKNCLYCGAKLSKSTLV